MKKRILFVCMGNICRSPAAEGVFRHMIHEQDLNGSIEVDSAGTIGYHSGDAPDSRMREAAAKRGYRLEGRARSVRSEDFEDFDLILAMDRRNYRELEFMRRGLKGEAELKLFCDYCMKCADLEVPDPYYSGREGFEHVLDLLEDGCQQLLDSCIRNQKTE